MTAPPIAHAEREHAPLSMSKAKHWLGCPGFVDIAADLPSTPAGAAAREGTRLHERVEAITRGLAQWPTEDDPDWASLECHLSWLAGIRDLYPDATEHVEERVVLVEGIIYSPPDLIVAHGPSKRLWSVDYKSGYNEVRPAHNPQLGLAALAWFRTHGVDWQDEGWTVTQVITQPGQGPQEWVAEPVFLVALSMLADMRAAQYVAKRDAGGLLTNQDPLPFSPSDERCHWCPAEGICQARAAQQAALFPVEDAAIPAPITRAPPAPATLTEDQRAQILHAAAGIVAWLDSIRAYSMQHPPAGWKVVEGRAVRVIEDEEGYARALKQSGVDPFEPKLIGLTAAEKALGKKQAAVIAPFLGRKPGKPALVPADDPRPAIAHFPVDDDETL